MGEGRERERPAQQRADNPSILRIAPRVVVEHLEHHHLQPGDGNQSTTVKVVAMGQFENRFTKFLPYT